MSNESIEQARERISRGEYQSAIAWGLVAIAEDLQARQRPAGVNLDLLRCNCGHAASRHNMHIDLEGNIILGSLGNAEIACDECDCLGFYTGIELVAGQPYPRPPAEAGQS